MPVATIVALLEALSSLAPQVPELITAVETAVRLLQSGKAPNVGEQQEIDAGLDAANRALQAS